MYLNKKYINKLPKIKLITIILFIFLIIVSINFFQKTNKYVDQTLESVQTETPLDFTHTWNEGGLSRTTLEFTQDAIYVTSTIDSSRRMDEGKDILQDTIITKNEYPKLFQQGISNASNIDSRKLPNFKDKYGGDLILLTNTQPSHGVYSPTYAMIISPFEGKVVFETPEYFINSLFPRIGSYPQENYLRLNFEKYGTDICNSCNLNFLDTYEYDEENSIFVLANNKHVDEFFKYLNQYEKLEELGCFYQEKDRSFTEIHSLGGDNAKCESTDDFNIDDPLTMSKFYAIKERLQRIVEGENISMFE